MLSVFLFAQLAIAGSQGTGACESSLQLSSATLFVEGAPVAGPFSLWQRRFAYLYLYLPERGLFTVATHPFEGAEQAGRFTGRTLAFSGSDAVFRLESATAILGAAPCDAWVRHEPNYHLNIQGPLYGYGDTSSVAEQWRRQFGTAGR